MSLELPNTDPIAALNANVCRCRAAAANAVWDTVNGLATATTEVRYQGYEGIYGRWFIFAAAYILATGDVVIMDSVFCLN